MNDDNDCRRLPHSSIADKLLTALCYRTIVLKSLEVETKDFLILPNSKTRFKILESDIIHQHSSLQHLLLTTGN